MSDSRLDVLIEVKAVLKAENTRINKPQILRLYDLLERLQPSPIVSLNRAVAVAMVEGPRSGLELIDAIAAAGDLASYHLLHSARADLSRRLGSAEEAAQAYQRALALVTNASERRFLERRLVELESAASDDFLRTVPLPCNHSFGNESSGSRHPRD